MSEFNFRFKIYWEDVDGFGIVHHSNYLKYMERARQEWLEQSGFRLDKLLAAGILFVVQKAQLEFLSPLRLYDEAEIRSRVVEGRRVAKVYEQIVRSAENDHHVYCRGIVQVVCVTDKLRPRKFPELMEK